MSKSEIAKSVTLSESLFEDRKESFLQVLDALIDRITSDSLIEKNLRLHLPTSDIIPHIERIIKKNLRNEQEIFLTYLMFNIIQIHRDSSAKLPEFAIDFKRHYSQLDAKYDPDGKLRQLLLSFRGKPCPNVITNFKNFLPEYLGFYFDSSRIRAVLMNLRTVIYAFVTDMTNYITETRAQCVEMANSFALAKAKMSKGFSSFGSVKSTVETSQRMNRIGGYVKKLSKFVDESPKAQRVLSELELCLSAEIKEHAVDDDEDDLSLKNLELTQKVEQMRQENDSLRKSAQIMKNQILKGNSDFENLYSGLEQLHSKIETSKTELASKQSSMCASDASAIVMKAKLLLEESTVAKMELAERELTITAMKKEMMNMKRQLACAVESERVCREKYVTLKRNAKVLLSEKQTLEDTVHRLNESALKVGMQLKAKEKSVKQFDQKSEEQEQKIVQLTESLSRKRDKNRLLSKLCDEQRESLSTLEIQYKELSARHVKANDELEKLREQVKFMKQCKEERDGFELEMHKLSLENENLKHTTSLLSEETKHLKELVSRLTKETKENQKLTSKSQQEADSVKSAVQKERAALDGDKRQLMLEREHINMKIAHMEESKRKADETVEQMKKEMDEQNDRIAEQLKEISEANKKRLVAVESSNALQKKQIMEQLEICQQQLSESHQKNLELLSENSGLKIAVDEAEDKFKLFKAEIREILPYSTDDSICDSIRDLINNVRSGESLMNAVISTLSSTRQKFIGLFGRQAKRDVMSLVTEFVTTFASLSAKMEGAKRDRESVEGTVKSVLDKLRVKRLDDIPRMIEDIRSQLSQRESDNDRVASEHRKITDAYAKLVRGISKYVSFSMEENIVKAVGDLKESSDRAKSELAEKNAQYNELLSAIRSHIAFNRPDEIPHVIKRLKEDKKIHQRKTDELAEELSMLKEKSGNADAKLESLMMGVPDIDIEDIPQALADLKSENRHISHALDDIELKHATFVDQLCEVLVGNETLHEDVIVEMVGELHKNEKIQRSELAAMQSSVGTVINQLKRIVEFSDVKELPDIIRAMLSERDSYKREMVDIEAKYKESVKDIQQLIEGISKISKINAITEIPMLVKNLKTSFDKAQERLKSNQVELSSFTSRMAEILDTDADAYNITRKTRELIDSKQSVVQQFETLKFKTDRIFGGLKDVVSFSSEDEIVDKVGQIIASEHDAVSRISCLEKEVKKITKLGSIEEIPEIMADLKEGAELSASQREEVSRQYKNFFDAVTATLTAKRPPPKFQGDEDLMLTKIYEMRTSCEMNEKEMKHLQIRLDDLVNSLHRHIVFDDETEIAGIVSDMKADLVEKNEKVDVLGKELQSATERFEGFRKSIMNIVPARRIEELPSMIAEMKQTNIKQASALIELTDRHRALVGDLQRVFKTKTDDEASLTDMVGKSVANEQRVTNELRVLQKHYSGLIDEIHEHVEFTGDDEIPSKLAAMNAEIENQGLQIENLSEKIKERLGFENSLKQDLRDVFLISDLTELPRAAKKMKSEFETTSVNFHELQSQHGQMVSRIIQTLGKKLDERSIPSAVADMKEGFGKVSKELDETRAHFSDIFDELRSLVPFDGDDDIVSVVKDLDEKNAALESEAARLSSELNESNTIITDLNSGLSSMLNYKSLVEVPKIVRELIVSNEKREQELARLTETHSQFMAGVSELITGEQEQKQWQVVSKRMKKQPAKITEAQVLRSISDFKSSADHIAELEAKHSEILGSLTLVLDLTNEDQVLQSVGDKLDIIKRQTAKIDAMADELESLTSMIESVRDGVAGAIEFSSFEEIPKSVHALKQDCDQSKELHASFLQRMREFLSGKDESELIKALQLQKEQLMAAGNAIEQFETIMNDLHEILEFRNESDLPASVKKLSVQCESRQKECDSLKSSLTATKASLDQLRVQHAEAKRKSDICERIFAEIRSTIAIDDEKELPDLVHDLMEENEKLKQNKSEQTLCDVKSVIGVEETRDILPMIYSMKSELGTIRKELSEHEEVLNAVHVMCNVTDNRLVPQILQDVKRHTDEIENQLSEASEFITKLLSNVRGNSILQTISFPLTKSSAAAILKRFREYIVSSQKAIQQYELFIEKAHQAGYHGNDCEQAHIFMAEDMCRKKENEAMEQHLAQLKTVREDCDNEKELLEKRIKADAEKMKKLREEKTELLKKTAAESEELYAKMELMQKEIGSLKTELDEAAKVREELLRLGAGDAFDADVLVGCLSPSEARRLKMRKKL